FRGLPVTVDDVCDLTGMSRSRARQTLELLVAGGVLASRRVEGNVTVWYDPHAMSEAAQKGGGGMTDTTTDESVELARCEPRYLTLRPDTPYVLRVMPA